MAIQNDFSENRYDMAGVIRCLTDFCLCIVPGMRLTSYTT